MSPFVCRPICLLQLLQASKPDNQAGRQSSKQCALVRLAVPWQKSGRARELYESELAKRRALPERASSINVSLTWRARSFGFLVRNQMEQTHAHSALSLMALFNFLSRLHSSCTHAPRAFWCVPACAPLLAALARWLARLASKWVARCSVAN